MKKSLFMCATAALVLTACSNDSDVAVNDVSQQGQANAVMFDTYVPNTTRAGQTGVMTTTTLQTTGFGVFATVSNDGNYASTIGPNFMYNQQVTYSTPSWIYTPVKYWPNETTADMLNATGHASSAATDKLSFFAYAPYVASTASTGAVAASNADENNEATPESFEAGITAMSANDDLTDPTISYSMAYTPSKSVDLLWGVAPSGGLSYTAVNNEGISKAEGEALVNLIKPSKDQKIKFLFKHALARLGLTVVAAVDQMTPGGTIATGTKIFVNSITIEDAASPKALAPTGTLNLNTASAGIANWTLGAKEKFKLVVSGTKANINTDLISTGNGVTTTEKNVILDNKYFMIIPTEGNAKAKFKVTIDYDVETTDANLDGGKSKVNNVIWKEIEVGDATNGFTNNKAYNLKLILGLTSVKLDAEVADWEVDGSSNVDLPRNEE